MDKRKKENEKREIKERAMKLLQSGLIFRQFLTDVAKQGLVGEQRNALVIYIACTSRLLLEPLSLLVKGASSAGKNFLAKIIFLFFCESCIHELSSSTRRSWNYVGDELRHGIVYLTERNEDTGPVHSDRLMISEGKLVHWVTVRRNGRFVTERCVTEGPVACISTTTKDLKIDDETRHCSVRIDESPEQSESISLDKAKNKAQNRLTAEDFEVWHSAQEIVAERAAWTIELPNWFENVARGLCFDNIAVRRQFPAFIQACRTVCLLRSFRRTDQEKLKQEKRLRVNFVDYAVTWLIFDPIFGGSLDRADDEDIATRQLVEKLSRENGGKPVQAGDLAAAMSVSLDRAYGRLRKAVDNGTMRRVNAPERTNRKLYLPALLSGFAPDPAIIFDQIPNGRSEVKFIHPLTGQAVVYRRGAEEKQNSEERE